MSGNQKRRPAELLELSELFNGIRAPALEKLGENCDFQEYQSGSLILQDSPVSGCVFIIDSGDVVISRRENDQEAIVARFISDECFGELDLFGGSSAAVTVRAENETRLLRFPRNGLSAGEIFRSNPAAGSQVVKNLLSMVAKRIRSTNNLISTRSPWVQELRKLVFVDKLTGLYNRTWLVEAIDKELEERRAGTAILIIKPDNFKTINDTYGHDAGDKTLSLLADTVRKAAAHLGTAARHGGDVFAVVYRNANAREVRALARDILRDIREIDHRKETGADKVILTASIGISVRKPGKRTPISHTVLTAFNRMLCARNSGGDRICETGGEDG